MGQRNGSLKVACVVLNYNDYYVTEKLIQKIEKYSIFQQIIIVDNSSTDGSWELLEMLKSEKISIWKMPSNKGYGAGNNFGIKIAKEKFSCDIAFIANPDVEFSEQCAVEIIKYLEKNLICAVVAPMQLTSKGKILKTTAWDIPTPLSYILSSLYLFSKFYPKKNLQKEIYQKVDCVAGAFLCVDIEKFLSVGGFDEKVFLYYEETILGLKMKEAGYETYVVTNQYYNHIHESSTRKSIPSTVERKRILLDSQLYVLEQYMKQPRPVIVLAKICYKIALIETYLKSSVVNLIRS